MSLRFIGYAALTVIVAITLLFSAKPIAIWIVEMVTQPPPSRGTPVAQVAESIGDVEVREAAVTYVKSITGKIPYQVYQHDAILVGTGSLARLIFQGGAEINVLEDSEIFVEFFNPKDNLSPVYLTLRRGDLEIKKPGLPGRLFIVKDKQVLSLAEWKAGASQPSKVVNVLQEERVQISARSHANEKSKVEEIVAATESTEVNTPVIKVGGEETLSNAYIERTLANKSPQFRRCQINSVRDRLPALGQMLFSIRIEPSGKVGEVRQLSTTIDNIHLTSCVTDVIQRSIFRSYAGRPITLSYPIEFQ